MLRSLHTYFFMYLIVYNLYPALGNGTYNDHGGNRIRLHLGPAIGFYSINQNHAANPRQRLSFLIGFTKEFKLGRETKTFFLVGADYLHHGLSFNSYYFAPDSVKLYDKNFNYTYTLFMNELQLPFQFKYLLRREDNSLFSPYFTIGYHLRFLMPGKLKIDQESGAVKEDDLDLKFKNPLLSEKLNAAVSLSLGWQKNNLSNSKGSFFAELSFRYGFSPYYFETNYSASSLFINSTHLSLQLGIKF